VHAVIIVLVYYVKDACIRQVLHHRSDSILADLISSLNECNLIASLFIIADVSAETLTVCYG
jgi:hypothetical protein